MLCFLCRYLKSSIGKKQIMGLTGLALCGFLLTHMAGNLLIIYGADAFNLYGHKIITNPLLIPMEIGLLTVFLVHIGLGLKLAWENCTARPVKYHTKVNTGRGATFASNTMPYTGLIILVFLVLHLLHFKWGAHYMVTVDGQEMRDLHRLAMELFSSLGYVTWYVFVMIVLGIHLSHGFASAFQSLGLNHPKFTPILKRVSCLYALLIAVGFAIIPIWAYLKGSQII